LKNTNFEMILFKKKITLFPIYLTLNTKTEEKE
jgi:hypothetical protein